MESLHRDLRKLVLEVLHGENKLAFERIKRRIYVIFSKATHTRSAAQSSLDSYRDQREFALSQHEADPDSDLPDLDMYDRKIEDLERIVAQEEPEILEISFPLGGRDWGACTDHMAVMREISAWAARKIGINGRWVNRELFSIDTTRSAGQRRRAGRPL